MNSAQELKTLITLRDAFADQLSNTSLDQPTRQQLDQLLKTTTQRIYQILDILIEEESEAGKTSKTEELHKTRSGWFNELSKNVLRLLAAKAITEAIDFEKIASVLKNL